MRNPKQTKKFEQKVEWMLEHRSLWEDLTPHDSLYVTQRARWRAIVNSLKDAGLISKKTSTIDVPVTELIRAAGKKAREER